MCESTVYIEEKGNRNEFMNDVARIDVTSDGIVCYNIIGERKDVKGVKLKSANLMNHSIVFEK